MQGGDHRNVRRRKHVLVELLPGLGVPEPAGIRADLVGHDQALEILDGIKAIEGGASLERSTDPETLGIAGGMAASASAGATMNSCTH